MWTETLARFRHGFVCLVFGIFEALLFIPNFLARLILVINLIAFSTIFGTTLDTTLWALNPGKISFNKANVGTIRAGPESYRTIICEAKVD